MTPAAQELSALRTFSGSPREFWPRYVQAAGALTGARKVVLLYLDPKAPQAEWRSLAEWSAGNAGPKPVAAFSAQLATLGTQCAGETPSICQPLEGKPSSQPIPYLLGQRLRLLKEGEVCVAALLLPDSTEAQAREALSRLQLAADVPDSYQQTAVSRIARSDVEKLGTVVELLSEVHRETRSLAAGLAFCNGVAARTQSERVSLGWLEEGYVRLQAISRTEHIDRKMAAAQALEAAMEECLDQDEEILVPAEAGANVISRDHDRFAESQRSGNVVSLPLRDREKAVGVLTCERAARPFSPAECQMLRLACDHAVLRLLDLRRSDVWWGARLKRWSREQAARLLGPEHTWAKLAGALGALALLALVFVRVPYRVSGNFILRSDEMAYVTAPFDGFLRKVQVRPGDMVPAGAPLLSLDTVELELEAASATADLARYQREAEKARAAKNLADMRIAQALADQARAHLDQVQFRLSQATLKSAFAGVVVEGDLRDRIGAPLKQGEALMKVARTDTTYVEAEVPERDIHEIREQQGGRIAFLSQPADSYPIKILRIEPAAVTRNAGNVFLVRCRLETGVQPWWRPGMVGVCRLEAGNRSLLWIVTHRTIDFLRLKLWW
jgi:multidrug resistance efflux pump